MSLEAGGAPVAGRAGQRHRLALLALVAAAPAGLSRDRLVALLWPEAEPDRARHLLSHSIYVLRQALGEDALLVAGDAVRLNPVTVWCDVQEFERALKGGDYARAVELYPGPFLDGFYLADNAEFERWVDGERERLAQAYARALRTLGSEREAAGDPSAAAIWWRRLAAHDPHNTRTTIRLVRVLEASGEIAGALGVARAHEALLREDLELGPPRELVDEVERLKREHAGRATEISPPRSPLNDQRAEPRPTISPPHDGMEGGRRSRRLPLVSGLVIGGLFLGLAVTRLVRDGPMNTVAPARPVVAVLPFQSMSADEQHAYFADALTDAIITDLARIPGLAVISRSSVDPYRVIERPLPAIAKELRAAFLVEGAVVREGPRVRITVQLIEATSDVHLWAESYERNVGDVLALQQEVAHGVAREIGVTLMPPGEIRARRPLASVPAYEAYLKGLYYSRSAGLQQGIEWFEQAIALDSTLAPAHAQIARNVYFQAFFGLVTPAQGFPRMRAAAEKAVALDDSEAEGHGTLALALMHWDHDWSAAERHFRRALELDPNNAQVRHDYSHLLLARRRLKDATGESAKAVELDPVNPGLEACLGWHELSGDNYQAAVAQSLRAVNAAPDFFWAHQTLGWSYEQMRRYPEAVASLRKAVELSGGLPFTQASLGHVLAASGNRPAAEELLARLSGQRERQYVSPYDLAVVNAGLGNRARAIELLLEAQTERSAQLVHLGWDPRLAALREDPRFIRLLRDLDLGAWITDGPVPLER